MNGGERWIALFDSIHHVIAAEQELKANGVWCDLVPVPRDLSSDCGMAIVFQPAELGRVQQIVQGSRVKWRDFYRPVTKGHEIVTHLLQVQAKSDNHETRGT
jgi:hypothetical protein